MNKKMTNSTTIHTIFQMLLYKFGPQNWWPIVEGGNCLYLPEFLTRDRTEAEMFEIMVGAVLTQNTAWDNVKLALINLKHENLLSLDRIKNCDINKLSELIKPAGYFNQKAKKLKILADFIHNELKGDMRSIKTLSINESRDRFLSIWGVGPETADSILLYAYHIPTFVIDAYTKRIFSRLGFLKESNTYDEMKEYFEANIPKDRIIFQEYHALIVALGKYHCKKTPECQNCPLFGVCPSAE